MKKQIFKIIIILVCFFSCLFTCKPYDAEETGEIQYTNVVYTPDENSVTIYLEGQIPVPRSLNRDIARIGCDYFEVTFLYRSSADEYTVARGEWMVGKTASISGVYRTGSVNYGGVSSTPAAGSGSTILFAGKSDKTIMAIGRLYMVDGAEGTIITANTKTVTFRLAAVTAAAATISGTPPAALTVTPYSFLTAAKDTAGNYQNVSVENTNAYADNIFATEEEKFFPLYRLEKGRAVEATYTFTLSSGGNSDYSFGAYSNGIFVAPAAFGAPIPGLPLVDYKIERKQPRYTSPNETFHQSILMLDEKTKIYLNNNNEGDVAFDPVVQFTLDTTDPAVVNGSVFSLVFSIPVYALAKEDDNVKKGRWYIRSSYGPSLYDLDDGTQGMGGAVLIGVGDVEISGDIEIYVKYFPIKWKYPKSSSGSRVFDIDGLEVWLRYRNTNQDIRKLEYNELDFIMGAKYVNPTWSPAYCSAAPDSPTYTFPNDFYGCLEVKVEYIHVLNGIVYKTSFFLLISNTTYDFSDNSKIQVRHIYSGGGTTANYRFTDLIQSTTGNSTVIVLLYESFDMENIAVNVTGANPARLFFFLAVRENIVIGRGRLGSTATPKYQGNQIYHWMANPGLNAYYFGSWPFRDPIGAAFGTPINDVLLGTAITTTYPYTVNSGGTVASSDLTDPNPAPNYPYSNVMIVDGQNPTVSSIYNVKVGPGVTIIPTVETVVNGETIVSYPLLH